MKNVRFRGKGLLAASGEVTELESAPGGIFVDEDALLSQSTFPIKPEKLIELTKNALRLGVGVDDETILADRY